ncbi:MAG: OmpH family outer membrane protein [Bacteroidales bacterium]|nr:OmpH family outer membrane protein [Bacteroidales bacterium]
MKRLITALTIAIVALLCLPEAGAQKYACVNTDYVLKSIPDYANAQKRLDKYVSDWQNEIDQKQAEIESLRASYEQESYLLPDNLRQRRKDDLAAKEQELRELQRQRFGVGGDLDKKRSELLKPIQDRVYSTIERIAHEKSYAFVFDRAGSATVLFASEKYDISNQVIELMGYTPGQTQTAPDAQQSAKTTSKPGAKPGERQGAKGNMPQNSGNRQGPENPEMKFRR